MNITQLRNEVEQHLVDITGYSVQVWLAPTEYSKSFGGDLDEIRLNIRIIVGEPDTEGAGERRVDDLFEQVPALVSGQLPEGVADLQVLSCSGHRVYSMGPGEPPMLGAEWNVKVHVD